MVPTQHITGRQTRCLGSRSEGITTYARTLLIHGVRATLPWVPLHTDGRSRWIRG
ncbi:MAG: hypothetical protein FJZ47_13385 [Candidatus Tectomicrobia bacterium]|uniref:Uncharacterized protein n=1 Tax=Tectimicrobiota bacterium TaxID=2528274 RepID=A0A937W0X9_UNCTE|nr:hypothetical protein [Candidatus Tectomicrobia bacterium]